MVPPRWRRGGRKALPLAHLSGRRLPPNGLLTTYFQFAISPLI